MLPQSDDAILDLPDPFVRAQRTASPVVVRLNDPHNAGSSTSTSSFVAAFVAILFDVAAIAVIHAEACTTSHHLGLAPRAARQRKVPHLAKDGTHNGCQLGVLVNVPEDVVHSTMIDRSLGQVILLPSH